MEMESSIISARSKRRRLLLSYVPRRSDLSATFESLSDDPLITILQFVGGRSYRSFGGVNKHCKEIYLATEGMTKETFLFGYAPLSVIKERCERDGDFNWKLQVAVGKGVVYHNRRDVMDWALKERNIKILRGICKIALEEERFDILNKVWNNLEDDDYMRLIFQYVDRYAAGQGKLNVLEWLEDKGKDIDKESCAEEAASGGHLHILKWLKEEKGLELRVLELHERFYDYAIEGGHLHVMKWLREQEVPLTGYAFSDAAEKGNLDILQWLHDEGCPWDRRIRVHEFQDDLKPEVLDWLRVNGYGDRISI